MTTSLSAGAGNGLGGATFKDIDALKCIFPLPER